MALLALWNQAGEVVRNTQVDDDLASAGASHSTIPSITPPMTRNAGPMSAGEEALAVAMRALVLVTVTVERDRRLSLVTVADRRIRAALVRHRLQAEADAAITAAANRLDGGR